VAVFPGATAWLVGDSDVLLVASTSPIDDLLANVARGWQRSGVAAGLSAQSVLEPFEILSLFAAGPAEMSRFAAGAAVQTDDRTALEFSGPRAVASRTSRDNASALRQAVDEKAAPAAIRQAREAATAPERRGDRCGVARRLRAHVNRRPCRGASADAARIVGRHAPA